MKTHSNPWGIIGSYVAGAPTSEVETFKIIFHEWLLFLTQSFWNYFTGIKQEAVFSD